jgi:uncharacterized membrane protein
MWHGSWGGPWGGFGWIIPLLAFTFMVVMVLFCFRRMGGMWHGGCPPDRGQPAGPEIEALRREIQELRDELRKLPGRA